MSGGAAIKLRPLGNRVLLRKIESDTRGGIVQPKGIDPEESTTQEYEVVVQGAITHFEVSESAGAHRGVTTSEGYVSLCPPVGARVYLARHKGWKIETRDGDELYVADLEDVLVVEESA